MMPVCVLCGKPAGMLVGRWYCWEHTKVGQAKLERMFG